MAPQEPCPYPTLPPEMMREACSEQRSAGDLRENEDGPRKGLLKLIMAPRSHVRSPRRGQGKSRESLSSAYLRMAKLILVPVLHTDALDEFPRQTEVSGL